MPDSRLVAIFILLKKDCHNNKACTCLDQALAQLDKPKPIWVGFCLVLENSLSIVQGPGRISTLFAKTRFNPHQNSTSPKSKINTNIASFLSIIHHAVALNITNSYTFTLSSMFSKRNLRRRAATNSLQSGTSAKKQIWSAAKSSVYASTAREFSVHASIACETSPPIAAGRLAWPVPENMWLVFGDINTKSIFRNTSNLSDYLAFLWGFNACLASIVRDLDVDKLTAIYCFCQLAWYAKALRANQVAVNRAFEMIYDWGEQELEKKMVKYSRLWFELSARKENKKLQTDSK